MEFVIVFFTADDDISSGGDSVGDLNEIKSLKIFRKPSAKSIRFSVIIP